MLISRNCIRLKSAPTDFAGVVKIARKKFPQVHFYTATAGMVYPAYINETEFANVEKLKNDLEQLKLKKSSIKMNIAIGTNA